MTTEEKIEYWVELSDYDLETAYAVLQTKRYMYVGFMCHQVIEKIFKAVYAKYIEDTPPFVHKLVLIARQGDFYEQLTEEQKDFIDLMEPLNIKTRYPDFKKDLVNKLTEAKCIEILDNTKNLQQWIKEKLLLIK